MNDYISPEYAETLRNRSERHGRHQAMLENHQQAKAKRREDHKRNGGRKFRYPGHLF